ncbi:type II secretion system F family protein [Leifsonia sp. NPDC077715]|uniref:type II secretion system F family protein n=1 Tax=Leifsonia sp. NPDC077715 TaxID=3155539 RepID=UPI00341B5FBE
MSRRRPGAAADAVAALTESLAVLLDAGLTPRSAWVAVASHSGDPIARRVVDALASRTSCARAVNDVATSDAAATDDLRAVAAAWSVAERAGSPLGPTLRSVAETVRDVAEAEREAEVALSGPRATARLVAWLPAAGALLSVGVGADILGAATTTVGAATLAAGLAIMVAGRWWMRTLLRRNLARSPIPGIAEELAAVSLAGGSSASAALEAAHRAARESNLPALDDGAARRILELAASAGAPAAELLTAAARQQRRVARAEARQRAATLGVRLMLPLGVCVLPSFLLLAVAPLVLSLLSSTTAGLR